MRVALADLDRPGESGKIGANGEPVGRGARTRVACHTGRRAVCQVQGYGAGTGVGGPCPSGCRGRAGRSACALRAGPSRRLHIGHANHGQPGNRGRADRRCLPRHLAACVRLRRRKRHGARLDHEPGALAGDRPCALREPKEAYPRRPCAAGGRGGCRCRRCAGAARAGRVAARRVGGAHAGRAPGDRNDVLRRAYPCRSRGPAEPAARHHQDAHPFRPAQAAAGADRGSGETMSILHRNSCGQSEATCAYALQVLPAGEVAAAAAHIATCPDCRRELESLRPVVDRLVTWPTDVLRPTTPLQARLADRIAAETGQPPVLPPAGRWSEPDWEQVAPGIECKLLATDAERHRVSMLVRLAPGASYPPHTHAGVEELHLLDGELWIDERKLFPGDYNYGAPGAGDDRVWSETGCTCVLITNTRDVLR